MDFFANHILSAVLFTPLVGALLLLLIPRQRENAHKIAGNVFGMLGFLVSLPLLRWFKPEGGGFTFEEAADWIPSIGAKYHLGIDGISLLLVMLTTFLGMIAILSSWSAIHLRTKEYYILLLLLQTGMIGVFVALDFFLFYVFWEVMLVPMYFLIGVWGSDRRLYAAIKFFLYTLAGSVVMLLAILALYFYAPVPAGHTRTFDVPTLLAAAQHFSDPLKVWLFWGFFFAFAIKVPMFPFHTWLLDAHTEAPTAGSVILAGVLLKMGTYGFIRFSLPLLPTDAAMRARIIHIVVILSIIGIVYGALVCLMQKDMKRLIAYSSVSHLGFCTLGIFALTPNGLAGSVLQHINHGISTAALFLIVGVVLGAAYLLWLYQRVMFGPVTQTVNEKLPDLNLREYATLVPLVILAFWIGIYPKPFFAFIERPVQKIVEQVNPKFYEAERARAPTAEIPAVAAETK